ncbi:hypothetical protein Sjap_011304 [Stephania japonica]|uniref:Uncharacterized protein n=1 Tax=Stephania japonica TaxID=461633 RepID=A0AAP0JD96_9MAGN
MIQSQFYGVLMPENSGVDHQEQGVHMVSGVFGKFGLHCTLWRYCTLFSKVTSLTYAWDRDNEVSSGDASMCKVFAA